MKNLDKVYLDLVHEKLKLIEKGYDRKLVEEGIFDFGKGLLALGGNALQQTIKGQIFEFFIGKLGIPTDSYIALAFKNLFQNVSFCDYNKLLTNCEFFVSQLAKALIEAFIDMWRKGAGFDNFIHKALKELLVEAATKTSLYQSLQKKLTTFVCPMLKEFNMSLDVTMFKAMEDFCNGGKKIGDTFSGAKNLAQSGVKKIGDTFSGAKNAIQNKLT